MKYAVSRIVLDLQDTSSPITLSAKQGDSVREIICGFRDDSGPYKLEPGCAVVFTAQKPSGNMIYNDCTVDGNYARYQFTAQTVSEIGPLKCEFKIFDDLSKPPKLTSPRFMINVEKPVFNDGDIPESSYEFLGVQDIVIKTVIKYLETHPVITDKTLALEDRAADAAAVGAEIKKLLPKSGGAMTGPIAMGGNKVTGLLDPEDSADAATKGYVDSKRVVAMATLTEQWAGDSAPYTQTVTISGLMETDMPHISPVYSDDLEVALAQRDSWGMVSKAVCSTGILRFICFEDKPTAAIPIQVEVMR